MENKPKRSKALIITIIILILVLISVYLIIKNRDSFGTKTSNTITKIFSPLLPSLNSKNLSVLVDYPFLGPDNKCTNKATNPPLCTIDTNNKCLNGTTNPPLCTLNTNNKCANGAVNSPLCTISSNNKCLNGTTNPPLCTLNTNNKCANGAVNSPLCTISSNNKCLNGTTNPPLCTISRDDQCFNGATNPPACTIDDDTNVNSYECSDDKDNDGDNKIDNLDPNCHIDGNLEKDYVSTHNSESESPYSTIPTPTIDPYNKWTQCSDRKDNDADEKIDELDPNCHKDGDLEKDYVSTHDSESESPKSDEPTVIEEENKCKLFEENPLLFTPEEKAKLAQLLRKYYLISSTLKTEVDITMVYNEMDKYNSILEQVKDLTNRCYAGTNNEKDYNDYKTRNPNLKLPIFSNLSPNRSYAGPTLLSGNPWFKETEIKSYLTAESQTGSGYCTGKKHMVFNDGYAYILNCKDPSMSTSQKQCEVFNGNEEKKTGCTWVQPTDTIDPEYERILNVW